MRGLNRHGNNIHGSNVPSVDIFYGMVSKVFDLEKEEKNIYHVVDTVRSRRKTDVILHGLVVFYGDSNVPVYIDFHIEAHNFDAVVRSLAVRLRIIDVEAILITDGHSGGDLGLLINSILFDSLLAKKTKIIFTYVFIQDKVFVFS